MALTSVPTTPVQYRGCPDGCRHVVFVKPDGVDVGALLRVDPSWDVALFVEEEFHRFILVATSPDREKLRVERWLANHGPTVLEAATQGEQSDALSGKHAGNSTPAEIADAAFAQLTSLDSPTALQPRGVEIAPIAAAPEPPDGEDVPRGRVQRGDYAFGKAGDEAAIQCRFAGPLMGQFHKTKGSEVELVAAFRHADLREAYFLFDKGGDYLLECVRFWGSRYQRAEATTPKDQLAGLSHDDVVKAMAPSLAPDSR